MQEPLIVSATLNAPIQHELDNLRYRYFPSNRYVLPAHLTLFHALPFGLMSALRTHLAEVSQQAALHADLTGLRLLGRGFAVSVKAPALVAVHDGLRQAFASDLTPQDDRRLHPHITLQNKVEPAQAKADMAQVQAVFAPKACSVVALCLWQYQGGPWALLQSYPFQTA